MTKSNTDEEEEKEEDEAEKKEEEEKSKVPESRRKERGGVRRKVKTNGLREVGVKLTQPGKILKTKTKHKSRIPKGRVKKNKPFFPWNFPQGGGGPASFHNF